jgi:acetylornithine deacetylase/succinyl-diaminopimelate desuccinylase-like protein
VPDPAIDRYVAANLDRTLDQLKALCRQPSISATGEGTRECAEMVAALLREYGFEARLIELPDGPPVVNAEGGEGDRTLVCYNHYDVQPPEPLELWDSPPFEPTVRDGKLYARGVSDDKGQLVSRLAALDAVRAVRGRLPVRVKFVVEGEEEVGSPHLEHFVEQHRDLLAGDYCVWETGGVNHRDQPSMTLGMRGILYVELSVETATADAHSGLAGSMFANAAWRLTWALASIKGPDERIRVPDWYDRAKAAGPRDLELLEKEPSSEDAVRHRFGLTRFLNDRTGLELKRAAIFEPTATINGIATGYQGPGSKTVMPCAALAKVDFRLVPDQDPDELAGLLRRHLDAEGFQDVALRVLSAERPARVDPDDPFIRLAARTAEDVFDRDTILTPMSGGSGPIWAFTHHLGVPVAMVGISYPGSSVHAPNEHVRLDLFDRGTRWMAHTVDRLGELSS